MWHQSHQTSSTAHSLCSYFSCSSLIRSLSGLRSTRFHQTHVRLWHPFCPLLQSVFSGTLENKSQWEKGDAFSTITGPSNWRGPLTFACLLLCRNTSVWQTPLGKDASRGPLGSRKTWQIIPQDKPQATFFFSWSLEILEISACCTKVSWGAPHPAYYVEIKRQNVDPSVDKENVPSPSRPYQSLRVKRLYRCTSRGTAGQKGTQWRVV